MSAPLDLRQVGDEYRVTAGRAFLRFRSVTPHHDGPTAIVEALDLTRGGRPHVDRLSLLSSRSRAALAKTLAARWDGHPWSDILDDACFAVDDALTKGPLSAELVAEAPEADACLVDGIIPLDQITVLYADGGSLKSYFALALAIAALRNVPLAPAARWCVRQCQRVLYLDWETDQRTHARRLWRLAQGLGISPPDGINYLGMRGRPMPVAAQSVSSEVARLGADLIIMDSLGMACGDEPETAVANLRTLGALSTLPGTKLVLAHVNAITAMSPNGPGRPYGSVFIRNTARSAIEARSEPDGDRGQVVTYHHRKANDGPLLPPIAIRYEFGLGGSLTLYSVQPDLTHATVGDQIVASLRDDDKTATALSEELDQPENAIRMNLHRLENRNKVFQVAADSGGRGKKSKWSLVDRNRNNDAE